MARQEDLKADDIRRGENPDRKDKRDNDRGNSERNINEERKRQGERGSEHDKEDMERQPE